MPQLSDFYGLIIWIYWDEDKSKHKEPHIHAEYAGKWAVLSIPEGNLLEADADFPAKKCAWYRRGSTSTPKNLWAHGRWQRVICTRRRFADLTSRRQPCKRFNTL